MRKLLVGLVVLGCMGCHAAEDSADSLGVRFQRTVKAMKALVPGPGCPRHLEVENPRKQGGEFDVERYFTVLTHLSMEEGYFLDYVYVYAGRNGYPVLYARKVGEPPYETVVEFWHEITKLASSDENKEAYEEYCQTINDLDSNDFEAEASAFFWFLKQSKTVSDLHYSRWYLDHVVIDGTEEGFLEFIALYVLGDQFYLLWHANYNDVQIVSDKASFGQRVPEEHRAQENRIDFAPHVHIVEDETTISLVTFSRWKGYVKRDFVLSTRFPHRIKKESSQLLLEYDCGIRF